MKPNDCYIIRGKIILSISVLFLILGTSLFLYKNIDFNKEGYSLAYESIDTSKIGPVKITAKRNKKDNIFTTIISNAKKDKMALKEIELTTSQKTMPSQEPIINKPIWRLPTEQGYITQYTNYNHIAIDLTSGRGTNERIYPVADGTISGIFSDSAGAKIVTVNHNINGTYYTSEYVHLSWYAPDIYVGKKVTTDNYLGGMGATGIATGIHLHITVLDCNLYDPSDPNCSTLNGFYNYGRLRYSQGFNGLTSLMNVPYRWFSR